MLERDAISSSKGSSQPRDRICFTCVSCLHQVNSLPDEPSGKAPLLLKKEPVQTNENNHKHLETADISALLLPN